MPTPTPSNILGDVAGATTGIFGLVTDIFDWVVANPLLVIYIAVGFIGIGFAIFGKGKHVAHN